MNFTISPSSGVPIYRQMYEQLEKRILSGQLAPGEFVPSVRKIATQLHVNPMTISKTYSLLEERGYLIRVRGKGMQVAHRDTDNTLNSTFAIITPQIDNLVSEAHQLNISKDELQALFLASLAKEYSK